MLVRLHNADGSGKLAYYSHLGSINSSKVSSKVNREMAVQVESPELYAELVRVFEADWNLAGLTFLPLVMRNYRTANTVVISEVLYDPSGPEVGKEWVELYNPTVPNMIPAGTWDGFGLVLGNSGDVVILRDAAGKPVDAVVWGNSRYPAMLPHPGVSGGDHSLERFPADRDGDDCAADFREQYLPTPGSLP